MIHTNQRPTFDDHLKTLREIYTDPLTCNYCGEMFDDEQLEPTYYKEKFTGLACPECLTELKKSNEMETSAIEKEWESGKTTDEVFVKIKGTKSGICEVYGETEAEAREIAEFIAQAPETKKQRDELLEASKKLLDRLHGEPTYYAESQRNDLQRAIKSCNQ